MEIFVGLFLFALLVLGLLCLLVLEYQNRKTRQCDRLWAQRHPTSPTSPIPTPPPTQSRSKPLPYSRPASVA